MQKPRASPWLSADLPNAVPTHTERLPAEQVYPKDDAGLVGNFMKLDPNAMQSLIEVDVLGLVVDRSTIPGTDQPVIVHPHTTAIVHREVETIIAGREPPDLYPPC